MPETLSRFSRAARAAEKGEGPFLSFTPMHMHMYAMYRKEVQILTYKKCPFSLSVIFSIFF